MPQISKTKVWDLWASNGEEMVRFESLSLFKMYTNFYFSTAAIMNDLPLGSHAMNSPGTILLTPVFP